MCCEHLVCASCAGPVASARCDVCRGARAALHGSAPLPYAALAAAIMLLLALALLLSTR